MDNLSFGPRAPEPEQEDTLFIAGEVLGTAVLLLLPLLTILILGV